METRATESRDRTADGPQSADDWVEPPFTVEPLKLTSIRRDDALKMRADEDESPSAVREFAAKYREEKAQRDEGKPVQDPMPLGSVFRVQSETDPSTTEDVLVDGWHRFDGQGEAGIDEWEYRIYSGTRLDAAKFAARANKKNKAVRWGVASQRNTVLKFLALMPGRSNRVIAKAAGLDEKTVRKHKPAEEKGKPTKGDDDKVRSPPRKASTAAKATADGPQSSTSTSSEAPPVGSQRNGNGSEHVAEAKGVPHKNEAISRESEISEGATPSKKPNPRQAEESTDDHEASTTIVLPRNGVPTKVKVNGELRVADVTDSEVTIEVLGARLPPPAPDSRVLSPEDVGAIRERITFLEAEAAPLQKDDPRKRRLYREASRLEARLQAHFIELLDDGTAESDDDR